MMPIDRTAHETLEGPAKGERLAAECSKLDPEEEQSLADLGLEKDFQDWPEYD